MDLAGAAAFHLTDDFEGYNAGAASWSAGKFKGKLEYAPESFAINDLSTRKRMLMTPGISPSASVIRACGVPAVYLVENAQYDIYRGSNYQRVYNVHEARGPVEIWRKTPAGPIDNPGWAVDAKVQDTFGDSIFQRVPMDQERTVNQYGLYTVYLPADAPLKDKDTVIIGGVTYFIFEVFWDQGLRAARATNAPDMRQNIVYRVVTQAAYDSTQLKAPQTETPYNVTAQVEQLDEQELSSGNVADDKIRVLIDINWIAVVPKIDDKLVWSGKTYRVKNVKRKMTQDQWELTACV